MSRIALRGALVVDGTGAPGVHTDVTIDGDTIVAVGPADDHDAVVDLDGLVLAPGFIDPHTHLDAQVLWDPDLTPSSWHGVTTAVVGNCGFGIAPARPEHRDTLVRTLENVEGMSADALRAGIDWDFESFPEYLAHVASREIRLNIAALVGHTPIRLAVLGDDASEREATEDEIVEMESLVDAAIRAGGIGFATSRSKNHQGAGGRPVPSRLASHHELVRLAIASRAAGGRIVQLATGPGLREPEELAAFADEVSSPVTWTALLADIGHRGESLARLEATRAGGDQLWAQIACRPIVTQTTMRSPTAFGMCPAFAEVLGMAVDRRAEPYRDESWRRRARAEADEQWGHRWGQITIAESRMHPDLVGGASVAALASDRGTHPLDVMLDVAVDDDLETRFRLVLLNDDEDEISDLLHADGALLALSDAGAHASQLCDACYTTDLLGGWVRDRGAVSLERAIWHLTGSPAERFGFERRGRVAAGFMSDLVAFDPASVAAGELERVSDLPAGADRLISRSTGVEHVWVAGSRIRRDGRDTDERPGRVLTG
jgi:N-acyl-D-amino-acid deacylase